MMADQQDDQRALLNDSGEPIGGRVRLDNVILNIAVTGNVGSGKSSFVNAIRGLKDTDGAANIGQVETTLDPIMYPHPTLPNVNLWDLPGIGGPMFKAQTYMKDVKFNIYDFFIIVSASRFKENDMMLAKEIKKKKKNFYFVHTMTDLDVTQEEKRGVTEEATLQKIRNNCLENLITLGPPPVFLITSYNLERFDFQELVNNLERDLPDLFRQSLDRKYNTFRKAALAVAFTSGAIAAVRVPGLSLACNVVMVAGFLTKCYDSFGLNDGCRERLSKRVNKPILAKVRESSLVMAIADKSSLAKKVAVTLVAAGVVESLCSLEPGSGSIAAAGVSFVTTQYVLHKGLDELYSVAERVIEMAGLK